MKVLKILFLLTFLTQTTWAQNDQVTQDIFSIIQMDSIVITASRKDFDVMDFIRLVQQDSSFFQAFHNLRLYEHEAYNDITIYDKKKSIKASYTSNILQKVVNRCRTMEILDEDIVGDFFEDKNRTHRYYTARMHEEVFLTKGTICEKRNTPSISSAKLSGTAKHINELKKLIFQPGTPVDVPLIGNKMAIFDEDMLKYYDFSIQSKYYKDKGDCYVFSARAKPAFRDGKTIIKNLETYFNKANLQVVSRNYHLQYDGLFDFDVKMLVDLQKIGKDYLPATIEYKGDWKVPTKPREVAAFYISVEAK